MSLRNKHSLSHQIGFSLVEILVGLVIGLLATLVIMQVFSVFEGQKRTTTGAADSQTNGGIALYSLVRDLQMAGYGLLPVDNSAIKCAAPIISAAAAAGVPGITPGVTSLSPITITDGGTAPGASDSITVRYGNSSAAGTPMPITLMNGADASVANNLGCERGIAILLTGPTTCNVTTATQLTGSTSITLGDTAGATAGIGLACLGQWSEITFRANAGNLERNVYPNVSTPSVADIVNIQAQYGISNNLLTPSNLVDQWVDATAPWDAPTTAARNRIKAVRVAVVARNGLLEKTNVSNPCSSLTSDAPTGLCAWSGTSANPIVASPAPAINLSNDPDGTSWQRYRYRVFEAIIPLRNVIWSKGVLP